jgi:PTS system ascorbate-specific IIA component
MIGILIVAHGAFGEAIIHSASHVLGKRPAARAPGRRHGA